MPATNAAPRLQVWNGRAEIAHKHRRRHTGPMWEPSCAPRLQAIRPKSAAVSPAWFFRGAMDSLSQESAAVHLTAWEGSIVSFVMACELADQKSIFTAS